MCNRSATKFLIEGYAPDSFTLSCDEHEQEMRSDTWIETIPFPLFDDDTSGATCCHLTPEELAAITQSQTSYAIPPMEAAS